jgi:hypothetical protein
MKSWIRGGIVSLLVCLIILLNDIIGLGSSDLFGFSMGFLVFIYIIPFILILVFAGVFFGWIVGKIKIKSEEKSILFPVYLSLAIVSFFLFIFFFEKSFFQKHFFIYEFYYIPPLIFFILLGWEFFNSRLRITILVTFLIALILVSLSFTSMPCKVSNHFCKEAYCSSAQGFDRQINKCVENVEFCTERGFGIDAHKDCLNNDNGKVLCDSRLNKCVENVEFCIDNGYCRFNINGKTFCHDNKTCVILDNYFFPKVINESGPGWVTVEGEVGRYTFYPYNDSESIEEFNQVLESRNR